uniref:Uncharacterized protein n=1 Tax=Plectus sambesii TaxID=2011161 RepID=A0A914WBG4_9BILA
MLRQQSFIIVTLLLLVAVTTAQNDNSNLYSMAEAGSIDTLAGLGLGKRSWLGPRAINPIKVLFKLFNVDSTNQRRFYSPRDAYLPPTSF